jgi:hypothetical protein
VGACVRGCLWGGGLSLCGGWSVCVGGGGGNLCRYRAAAFRKSRFDAQIGDSTHTSGTDSHIRDPTHKYDTQIESRPQVDQSRLSDIFADIRCSIFLPIFGAQYFCRYSVPNIVADIRCPILLPIFLPIFFATSFMSHFVTYFIFCFFGRRSLSLAPLLDNCLAVPPLRLFLFAVALKGTDDMGHTLFI